MSADFMARLKELERRLLQAEMDIAHLRSFVHEPSTSHESERNDPVKRGPGRPRKSVTLEAGNG